MIRKNIFNAIPCLNRLKEISKLNMQLDVDT